MELLNNRYKIVKSIKQSRLLSTYMAVDVKRGSEPMQLNIINPEYIPDTLLNFYIREFTTLTTIENKNIARLYDFGLISFIDNKKVDSHQYYYTSESVSTSSGLMQLIKFMDQDEILNLFLEICQSLNYLHLRGFIYGDINVTNVYIENFGVKLKDIATIELEKYDYWGHKNSHLVFKAPEILAGENPDVSSDIYSLGVLLYFMCKKEIDESISVGRELLKFKNIKDTSVFTTENYRDFLSDIIPVIEKMIEHDPANRYSTIGQVIADVNRIFNRSYINHKQEEIEKLNFRTKIFGREYEINNIVNIYNSMVRLGIQEKFVSIHGEYGIGKTKLLKELERILIFKAESVYSSFTLENANDLTNRGFNEILRKIISECDQEVLGKYEAELIKLVPELGDKKKITPVEPLMGDKEKVRILNSTYSFINDYLKGKPAVFIIDNLHMASSFSIELLEYIYLRSKNIMVVFSYCDGEISNNKRLTEFVSKVSGKSNFIDIHLRGLNNEDAVSMIQDILRTPTRPNSFGGRISSKTYGNPQFIEETIKKLFAEKIIYVDENTGIWNSKYDYDYNQLPIPSNMEQAVLSQLNDLDSGEYEVLKALSIFNLGIPSENLINITTLSEDELLPKIDTLESKGIICKKIEDRGFVYDFSNRILKKLIRDRLDSKYKKEKHELAAAFLENQYSEAVENKDELIYHLEKSGQMDKVVRYCVENADKMEAIKNKNEAIRNLQKAITMLQNLGDASRKSELLIRLGSIYDDMGNSSNAVKCFQEAQTIAVDQEDFVSQVNILNKLANIYYKKNQISKTLSYIKKCEKILYKVDFIGKYTEGYLQCKEIQARVYLIKQNYDKVNEICKRGINLCGDKYYKLKGLFYKNLGNSLIETGKTENALSCYNESLLCFEAIDFPEGKVIALNNIAVVYGDFYQDIDNGIVYLLKMKDISEKNHIIVDEMIALANLGTFCFYEFQNERAVEYLLSALEKAKDIEYESIVFYSYNYLANVYLRLRNYKEAYKYYIAAKRELEEYPEHGREIAVYYQMSAELFFTFGDYDKAKEFIDMTLNVYREDELIQKWDAEVLLQQIEISRKSKEEDIIFNIRDLKNAIGNYKSPLKKINALYDTAIILYQKGHRALSNRIFEESKKIKLQKRFGFIEAKELFLRGDMTNGSGKPKYLAAALETAKIEKDKVLHWNICCALGDLYFAKKDYFYAVNYYFEACEVIKNLAMQLPDELAGKIVNLPGLLKPFSKLTNLRGHSDYNNIYSLDNDKLEVYTAENVKKLFNYEEFDDILSNKYFIKSAKKIYNSYLPKGIRNLKDIIRNLYSEPIKNLELITKYIASVTFATKSLIIIDDFEQSYYAIASNDGTNQVPPSKFIFEKARAQRKPILLTENSDEKSIVESGLMPQDAKAVICIPIIMNSDEEMAKSREEKRKTVYVNNPIRGYLYLESDRILNNFNEDGLRKCQEVCRLAGSILEKYQLQISSSTDKLTGMLTRKSLEDALSENIDRSDEYKGIFSIIMLDMDHFKQINDKFGHQTGDEVLRKACSIIRNNIRKDDVCGRYGGEEFIIILPETDSKTALAVADKLRVAIEQAKILGDKTPVTVSMGISTYPHHAQWKQELVEKADQALYISKELGRNRCQIWNSEFSSSVKGTNKLIGIISGNTVQDSRNVLVMLDIIELIKQAQPVEEKIFDLLGRIVEITEAEYGMLFTINEEQIDRSYCRKKFSEDWTISDNYNTEIIKSVVSKKQGVYMTDWDDTINFDTVTGMPDWQSIVVVPLIKNGKVKGILYLTVSTKIKEFKLEEFNFINALGEMSVGIL